MKATHKLVSLVGVGTWDLVDTEHGLYYKMTSPRQSDGWEKSISSLLAYTNSGDFSCKQINKFKGNK